MVFKKRRVCLQFLFLLLWKLTSAQGVTENYGINVQFFNGDSIRTFSVLRNDKDACLSSLNEKLGSPFQNTVGEIIWKNVSVPGLGNNLVLRVRDGIFRIRKNSGRFQYFRSQRDKERKLRDLSDGCFRYLTLEISNPEGENAVKSREAEQQALKFLDGILLSIP